MTVRWLAALAGAITIIAMIDLLRREHVKEKYAVLWVAGGVSVAVLSMFPSLLDMLADLLRLHSGPNLLFLAGVIALGLVCVHLSLAVSKLENNNRTPAEEVGFLELEVAKGCASRRSP